MAGVAQGVYNLFVRRNPIFLTTIFVSAFAIEMAFDSSANRLWDYVNKGRQWRDIKHRYLKEDEEE